MKACILQREARYRNFPLKQRFWHVPETRNNKTKRAKRNHRNKRNDQNEKQIRQIRYETTKQSHGSAKDKIILHLGL